MENRMKLDQQQELLVDAIRATSEYYHIAPIYIEKDYWISKILQQLSRSCYAENTVFKGGTSLSKGYGLISRFSAVSVKRVERHCCWHTVDYEKRVL